MPRRLIAPRLVVFRFGVASVITSLAAGAPAAGPHTTTIDFARYAARIYVDQQRGDDAAGDGSPAHPWASLTRALETAAAPGQRIAVLVSQGRYHEPTLLLKSRVDIFGGFAEPDGTRDVGRFPTVLDGGETQRIALGADDVQIDGMQLANGRVRGKGAALLCDGTSPVVTNCTFVANRTAIPRGWDPPQLHLTAHDGGAIVCLNGAAPRIEHCLFYNNTTECGRGGALAGDRGARPRLAYCVLANNRAGIDDPMRSSDGGAISLFDHSGGEVVGNIIVANRSLTRNDAGGIFVALWSAPHLADNVIVGNEGGDDAGGLFIGGQEHRYGAPLDAYPPAEHYNVVVERNVFAGNDNASHNSGAMRITMETRARLADNLIAENTGGMYLQRSEIIAERNTVWQDWRFLEDKPSLGPSRFTGNILRGPVDHPGEARVTLQHNMVERAAGGTDSREVQDLFLDDGVKGKIAGMRFDAATSTTIITSTEMIPPADYAGRPVLLGQRKGGHWLVIKEAGDHTLVCWGRVEAETHAPGQFEVLRTFTLKPDAPADLGARLSRSAP